MKERRSPDPRLFNIARGERDPHLIEPAQWVFLIIKRDGRLGQLERMLRVEHDR